MAKETKIIELKGGSKVTIDFEEMGLGVSINVTSVENPKPKAPEYVYSKFEPNLTQFMNLPLKWRKNKDGLDIYLDLVRFNDANGKYSVALVMTDKIGRILESGCLLKFKEGDDLARLIPSVGDQYPGAKGLNGEIAVGVPECLPVE